MIEVEPGYIPNILIIEDSQPDLESICRVFKKLEMKNPIHHCLSGDEALDYLHHRNQYSDSAKAPKPSLILLDLNIAGTDGRDVLKDIKNDPELKSIPVVVLTTSSSFKDISECYQSGANSYMIKPANWTSFYKSIEKFKNYFLETAILPDNHI